MGKRMLDIRPDEFKTFQAPEIINAIKAAEGRSLACEIVAPAPALFGDVSNAEIAAAFGADMLLLNMYDVDNPRLSAFEADKGETLVETLKKKVGRFVAINLEPVSKEQLMDEKADVAEGRRATAKTALKAYEQGVQMILLTGNPKTGVTNKTIVETVKSIRKELGDKMILAAGKMHSAGIAGETAAAIITKDDVLDFINAGADIILVPAPGTVPGMTQELVFGLIEFIHKQDKLAMTAIGTSQEGADEDTIRRIALMSKMAGADLHHIGDAGFTGIAVPENITAYSKVIRGIRHTYRRMGMR